MWKVNREFPVNSEQMLSSQGEAERTPAKRVELESSAWQRRPIRRGTCVWSQKVTRHLVWSNKTKKQRNKMVSVKTKLKLYIVQTLNSKYRDKARTPWILEKKILVREGNCQILKNHDPCDHSKINTFMKGLQNHSNRFSFSISMCALEF